MICNNWGVYFKREKQIEMISIITATISRMTKLGQTFTKKWYGSIAYRAAHLHIPIQSAILGVKMYTKLMTPGS